MADISHITCSREQEPEQVEVIQDEDTLVAKLEKAEQQMESEAEAESQKPSNVVSIGSMKMTSKVAEKLLTEQGYDKLRHQANVRASHAALVGKGLHTLVLDSGLKSTTRPRWQNSPIPQSEDFKGFCNIGLFTGKKGLGLIDLDIDVKDIPQSVIEEFLPPTQFKFGRYYGKNQLQITHYLYRDKDYEAKLEKPEHKDSVHKTFEPFVDKSGKRSAIELRMDGAQTMAPGSTIIDDKRGYIVDSVRWEGNNLLPPSGDIPAYDRGYLIRAKSVLMLSYYCASSFKPGSFHDEIVWWCGFLLSAGVEEDLVEKSVRYCARVSGQTDIKDRLNSITTTKQKIEQGDLPAGISFLRRSENWDNSLLSWAAQCLNMGTKGEEDHRPSVRIITSKEPEWADLTLEAMVETDKFYQISGTGQVCVVAMNEGKAGIVILDKSVNTASWLTREIRFTQGVLNKATGVMTDEHIKCPTSLALELSDATTYKGRLKHLRGISNTPLITPHGRIVDATYGYDPELKLFSACEFPLVHMYADEAMGLLEDVLQDFPFSSPRYKAAAIGAILTAVIRPVLDICPLHVITSSQYSDGKSVLSGVIAAVVGVEASLGQLTRGGSDEEQEKQLSAILSRGKRVVTLDNHDGEFRSAALTETLTSMNPEFRVLGKNETRSVPNNTMFLLNGVNTSPSLDLQTRSVFIRLARKDTNNMRKFKHADVVGYALSNRAKLVSAAITLIRSAMDYDCVGWEASHRFKMWDYMVRRTIMSHYHIDIAPPTSEDSERPLDSMEEARNGFLEMMLNLWKAGMRSDDSKSGNFFRSSDIAHRIAPESEQEAWVNILSKRPKQDLIFRCGYALGNVKEYPFKCDEDKTWRLECYAVKGKSAYKMVCFE